MRAENRFRKLMQELDELENASIVITCRTMFYDIRRDLLSWTSRKSRSRLLLLNNKEN